MPSNKLKIKKTSKLPIVN